MDSRLRGNDVVGCGNDEGGCADDYSFSRFHAQLRGGVSVFEGDFEGVEAADDGEKAVGFGVAVGEAVDGCVGDFYLDVGGGDGFPPTRE